MTRDKCHALGVELANTVWPDFPVLVVSHFEQAVDGTDNYHWHNHFIVYNCAVTDGHKIDTKKDALNCQKRFVAMQAEGNGLTSRGLVLTPDGLIQGSMRRDKIDRAERYIEKRGRAKGEITFMTQKAELRLAISTAAAKTRTVDEFSEYLQSVYGVKTKFTRGAISYQHPDRTNEKNSWIRGNTLGEAYTKEGVINAINKQRNRTSDLLGSAEERYERTAEYAERRNVPSSNEEAAGRRPAISDDVAAERYERILARHRELLGASDENTERNVRKSDEQRRNDTFSRAGSSERQDRAQRLHHSRRRKEIQDVHGELRRVLRRPDRERTHRDPQPHRSHLRGKACQDRGADPFQKRSRHPGHHPLGRADR